MSNRIVPYIVLPLIAAAFSILNLVNLWLSNLMRPFWPGLTTATWWVALAVIVAAVVVAMRAMESGRRIVPIASLAVILLAGFAPWVADVVAVTQMEAEDQAEGAVFEMEFQDAYLKWSDEVAARFAEHKPWTADEGLAFLEFAAAADLSWRSLPDHTPEAFALVREALQSNVLDPNAVGTGAPVADSATTTLTVLWYDRRIRPGSPSAIERRPWQVLQILVENGADLAGDDAAGLRADLAKTVVEGDGKSRFISLEWGEAPAPAEGAPPAGGE